MNIFDLRVKPEGLARFSVVVAFGSSPEDEAAEIDPKPSWFGTPTMKTLTSQATSLMMITY